MATKSAIYPKAQKSSFRSSEKTRKSGYKVSKPCQKKVMKQHHVAAVRLDVERLKISLGQMVSRLSDGGKVQAYEHLAAQLSALAGLDEPHVWGWRYVASVHSGTVRPGKKFVRALQLLHEHVSPRQKQWFYFAHRRRYVAAIYDRTIRKEIIIDNMRRMGYKAVTFSKYMELKRRKA